MEDKIIEEKMIDTSPVPVSIIGMEEILEQMKYSTCKITYKNEVSFGTGFFCNMNYKGENIRALITNYHNVNEENFKKLIITMNNENIVYEGIINEKSRKYFDKELDVTIIELIDKENELEKVKYLELDDNLFLQNSEYTYQNKTVYIPQYPNGGEAFVSFGLVENMENHEIYHNCCTDKGSSGSPILNIKTQKLLGIHRGYSNKFEMNKGSFLKRTIQEFFQTYNIEKKEEINEIKMKVKIIKGEIGKKIYFLGEIKRDFIILHS